MPDKFLPSYINVVRDPVERRISNLLYMIKRGKLEVPPDFNIVKCFLEHQSVRKVISASCFTPPNGLSFQLCSKYNYTQICFFAGNESPCGYLKANRELQLKFFPSILQTAKYHVEHRYAVVGLTSNLYETFLLLEAYLPSFFKGTASVFE